MIFSNKNKINFSIIFSNLQYFLARGFNFYFVPGFPNFSINNSALHSKTLDFFRHIPESSLNSFGRFLIIPSPDGNTSGESDFSGFNSEQETLAEGL
jgi:hypothetical protein